jgi:hypothetical protein
MLPEPKSSAQVVVETMATLFLASTHYAALRNAINELEATTFALIDSAIVDKITDAIQTSVFTFFMDAGGILADDYSFDPFMNLNFHSALCSDTYVPFGVTLLFGEGEAGENVGSIAIGFCLRINEGRISILCE